MAKRRIAEDLSFVRGVIHRAERLESPRVVYVVWAVIVLIGFPLPDFAPQRIALFWGIIGPIGLLASIALGARHGRRVGQYDSKVSLVHLSHWGIMLVAVALSFLLPAAGFAHWRSLGPQVLLLVSVFYLLAGLHIEKKFFAPGAMMIVGYGVLVAEIPYAWTIAGVAVSAGLLLSGLGGGARRVPASR